MISAISPVASTTTQAVTPAAALPIASQQSQASIRSDSLAIANTYGFAPVILIATAAPVIYQAVNSTPGAVSAVTKVVHTERLHDQRAQLFDRYA